MGGVCASVLPVDDLAHTIARDDIGGHNAGLVDLNGGAIQHHSHSLAVEGGVCCGRCGHNGGIYHCVGHNMERQNLLQVRPALRLEQVVQDINREGCERGVERSEHGDV